MVRMFTSRSTPKTGQRPTAASFGRPARQTVPRTTPDRQTARPPDGDRQTVPPTKRPPDRQTVPPTKETARRCHPPKDRQTVPPTKPPDRQMRPPDGATHQTNARRCHPPKDRQTVPPTKRHRVVDEEAGPLPPRISIAWRRDADRAAGTIGRDSRLAPYSCPPESPRSRSRLTRPD